MKYTFHMVRDNQDKAAFAARMNLMFPDAEKKCVVESFRKQETQKNHNHHFSEWLAESDPDYNTAQSLYEKLKKTEEYNRSIWGRRSTEGVMGGRTFSYIFASKLHTLFFIRSDDTDFII